MDVVPNGAGGVTVMVTVVAAAAASLTTVLNGLYVWLSHRALGETRRQRAPLLIAYVAQDPDVAREFDIVIENVGREPAYSVSFDIRAAVPSAVAERVKELGAIRLGIAFMAPNQRITSSLGGPIDLGPHFFKARFEIVCNYTDAEGKQRTSSCPVDLHMYENL